MVSVVVSIRVRKMSKRQKGVTTYEKGGGWYADFRTRGGKGGKECNSSI
jgi:hypothetical protein